MFKGSIVALVTPFDINNNVDEKALANLVEWHIKEQTDAIVCCGTTGEAPTLTDEEKARVIDVCVRVADKRCRIIAGTGTNSTSHSVHLTSVARKLGVDGCLAVVPYYNKPMPMGCIAHFNEIAKVGLPLIIYHHPGRTSIRLSGKVFKAFSEIENIVAIKESSCDLGVVEEIKKFCVLPILSGDDELTVQIMQLGGVGVISVVANILPSVWKKITTLCFDRNYKEAFSLLNKYKTLLKALSLETNPQGIKYCLSLMEKCRPNLRLPMIEPSFATKEVLSKHVNSLLDRK